jgi:hypothetical protein
LACVCAQESSAHEQRSASRSDSRGDVADHHRHLPRDGLLLALAGSTIERAIAEGWLRDTEMTADAINATFAQHGFGWRLTRLQ